MEKKKRKSYTNAKLASALQLIQQGMSIYQVSRQFNIPETTLRNKRDGIYENATCGVQPVLNIHEEKQVVDWIHYLGKCGFPVKKDQLLDTVGVLVKNLKRPNRFKDGRPGKNWFLGFLKRHPTVTKRVAQNLPLSRNQITEESIRTWFDRVHSYFEENDLLQVFEDPRRIFNCDETAFFLSPKEKQVLVKRGSKHVYNRVANDEKECLTVLVNVSANGDIAPPLVVYPYKKDIPKNIKLSVPGWWGLGNTESGWMTMESFYEYVTNVFYPWLQKNEVTFPVVLFLDGHTSHISLPLTTFCKENGIVLIALLPNATHVLQPLDVAVFRPVKGTWKDIVHDFRISNDYKKLTRADFAKEIEKCFARCLKPETIKNGFKCCGIFPFDSKKVNYDKLLPQEKLLQENHSITENSTDQNDESHIAVFADEDEYFKKNFENRMSPNTLRKFKDANGHWNGDPTYEKLFWWNITSGNSDCYKNTAFELGETTLTNNVDQENISEAIFNLELRSDSVLTLCSVEETGSQEEAMPTTSTTEPKTTSLRMQIPPIAAPKLLVTITTDSGTKKDTLPLFSSASPEVSNPVENRCLRLESDSISTSAKVSFSPDAIINLSPKVKSISEIDIIDETIIDKAILQDYNIIPPASMELLPSVEVQSLTEKITFQHMRASTPKSSKCDSPRFSLSEVEDDTLCILTNTKQNQNIHTEQNQNPVPFQTNVKTVAMSQKIEDTLSTRNISRDIQNIPTPFKHISTPFKQAFYFPKVEKNSPIKKKIFKKITPTVATANEFIEYLKRTEKEKQDKEKLKQKRKIEALEKKSKKENIKRLKETQALQKNKNFVAKSRKVLKAKVSPMAKLSSSHQVTSATKDNKKLEAQNTSPENEVGSDDDSYINSSNLISNTLIVNKVKRRCFFDTDSDDSV